MPTLKLAFFVVWFATIAARLFCLRNMFRFHLAKSYPWFTAFLIVSTFETCARMYAGFTGGSKHYAASWAAWQGVTLVLMAGLVVECFILHAKHFRRFLFPGIIAAAVVTTAAIAAWFPTAGMGVLARPDSPAILKVTRDLSTVGFAAVSLTAIGFGMFGERWIRSNVRAHATTLQWFFFLSGVGHFVRGGVFQGQWFGIAAAFVTTGGALFCYVRWCVVMTEEGERWERPAPVSEEEILELERRRAKAAIAGYQAGR